MSILSDYKENIEEVDSILVNTIRMLESHFVEFIEDDDDRVSADDVQSFCLAIDRLHNARIHLLTAQPYIAALIEPRDIA